MKKHIHYEAAFEDFLRSRGVPYVPVQEARRAIFAGERIKSFDFIVYPGGQRHWIVDVKGRRFPYITERGGNCSCSPVDPPQGQRLRHWPACQEQGQHRRRGEESRGHHDQGTQGEMRGEQHAALHHRSDAENGCEQAEGGVEREIARRFGPVPAHAGAIMTGIGAAAA